jgi:hypothetical protein
MEEKIVNLTPHPLVIQRTCPRCNGQSCEDSQGECQQGIITETIESNVPASMLARSKAEHWDDETMTAVHNTYSLFARLGLLPLDYTGEKHGL